MAHHSSVSDGSAPTSQGGTFALATTVLFVVWLLLSGRFNLPDMVLGLLVAGLVAWLSRPQLALLAGLKFSPLLPWYLARYLAVFIWALLKANFDMARRVLSPRLPINPALVSVRTRLQSPLGQLILANSITLTPGTLSVDVEGDLLYVHWIDATPGADLEHATATIAADFERHLQEFLQ